MPDFELITLGADDDDDCTITREEYLRNAAAWPVVPPPPSYPRCHYCGRRIKRERMRFCTKHCRRLWEQSRARRTEDVPTGGLL